MQRDKGDFLRIIRQGLQLMIMQRNAPAFDARPRRVAGQQFPRRTQQHGAITFRLPIQAAENHQRRRARPGKPGGQRPKMPRAGGKGTFRRRINGFQRAAWRKALRRRQHLWRHSRCLPRYQGKQRQRGKAMRLQTGSQQKTSPERSSAEKAGFSAGSAYSSIISGVQPSPR
jgi:hypothetical protein